MKNFKKEIFEELKKMYPKKFENAVTVRAIEEMNDEDVHGKAFINTIVYFIDKDGNFKIVELKKSLSYILGID